MVKNKIMLSLSIIIFILSLVLVLPKIIDCEEFGGVSSSGKVTLKVMPNESAPATISNGSSEGQVTIEVVNNGVDTVNKSIEVVNVTADENVSGDNEE